MPLDRDQFKTCKDLLLPHVDTTPGDRRALVNRALHGSKVMEKIDWTGNAQTFATNLVEALEKFDDVTSLVLLLKTLRAEVGEPSASAISALIAHLAPPPRLPTAAARPGDPAAAWTGEGYVFISYSRQDFGFVDRLRQDLTKHGIPYWIDREGLAPGTRNWERRIRAAIQSCSAVVWVASPAAYASDYVDGEIAVAEAYEKAIYPVWADGDQWIDCVPFEKRRAQNIDMRGPAYERGLAQLIAVLRGSGEVPPIPPEPTRILAPGTTPPNPYKGLKAFEEADAEKFFGREALVARLAGRVNAQLRGEQARFLAVLGPSGAGKSSVVLAGLIPALRRGAAPGSDRWTYLPRIVPGRHPIEHLTDALGTVLARPLGHIQADLSEDRAGRMLHRLADQLPGERAVLYIDQFEELFALAQDEGERQQFISLITHAATEPEGKVVVLLSMRADFLDRPLNYPALGSLFNTYTELVRPMSIAEMRDAIEKPARAAGLTFDPELVAEIIFALRERDQALAGALPLLQFTLERLYEDRDGTRLTWDAYRAMGGVEGAIGTHSETVFCAVPEPARDKLGRVFLPLVNIDDSGEPTRRRDSLERVTADADARTLVEALVKHRLLQAGQEGGEAYYEVAHEALFRSWPRLAEWITKTRGDQPLLKELHKAAKAWDEHNRDRDYLWLGERGQEAQCMLDRLQPDLDDVERAFARPEHEHLLDETADIDTLHPRRSEISTRLHQLKHTLPGAGLRADGLPAIEWCYVDVPEDLRGKKIAFQDEYGKVYSEAALQPFYIAKYLVTYVQFEAFVKQDYDNPEWWRDMPDRYQRQQVAEARQPYANYPRDSVSWYQAVAFCRWLSAALRETITLPTEQQWQWAAQNGLERREYPWQGGAWDGRRCNTSEAGVGRSTAVGMYPHGAAACGALDMSGNLWEWCLNKYSDPKVTTIDDSDDLRVLRGGSWAYYQRNARAACRSRNDPDDRDDYYGFRVMRVPPSQ